MTTQDDNSIDNKKSSISDGFPTVSLPGIHSDRVIADTQVGPYTLIRTLGEGGFGYVFLAEQKEPIKRQVALKIIKPGMDTKRVILRFEAEKQALALLNHPAIAKVFDAGSTEEGRPYFVMEYVKGLPITEYCDKNKLSVKERLELFIKVCQGIHHAHQKGIIHRDIKPSNVLVSEDDGRAVPKIIDFGIAKAIGRQLTEETIFTEQGQLVGTPEFMSPEQADLGNQDIDTLTDVYSLGVLLYELLTGKLPFDPQALRRVAFQEIQRIISEQEPPHPSALLSLDTEDIKEIAKNRHTQIKYLQKQLHKELEWIPLKAMRKERERRYSTAAEFADDIQNYLIGNPLIAGPESISYRIKKVLTKYKYSSGIAGLLLVILISFSFISFFLYTNERKARQDLEVAQTELGFQTTSLVGYGKARMFIEFLDSWNDNLINRASLLFSTGKEKAAMEFIIQEDFSQAQVRMYLDNTSQNEQWFAHYVIGEVLLNKDQRPVAQEHYARSVKLMQQLPENLRTETVWYEKAIKSRLYDLSGGRDASLKNSTNEQER